MTRRVVRRIWPSVVVAPAQALLPPGLRTSVLVGDSRIGASLQRKLLSDARGNGRARERAAATVERLADRDDRPSLLLAARVRRASEGLVRSGALFGRIAQEWPDTMLAHVVLAELAVKDRKQSAGREHLAAALAASDERDVQWNAVLTVALQLGDPAQARTAADRIGAHADTLDEASRTKLSLLSAALPALEEPDSPTAAATLVDAVRASDALARPIVRWLCDGGQTALLRAVGPEIDPATVGTTASMRAARALRAAGDFSLSTALAEGVLAGAPEDDGARRMVEGGKSALGTLRNGWSPPDRTAPPAYDPLPRSVLYLVRNSLPHSSVGYSTRTQGLLSAMIRTGWEVRAATCLGYPYDTWPATDSREVDAVEVVDSVRYLRLVDSRRRYPHWPLAQYIDEYARRVEELARAQRASVVHAASNYINGLAAITAARRLGVTSVYEVRGLWEITRSAREPEYESSELFQLTSMLESAACREADHVLTITGALRDEIVRRGVPPEKVSILPNGVDTQRFRSVPRDDKLAGDLGIGDRVVIGYVGSVLPYEGIDVLLRAAAQLRERSANFHVLIVGDGSAYDEVVRLRDELGLTGVVTFTGRVPHEEIERYYSLIDIAPFPRLPVPVCEMVSPLKPFEAMAMGKVPVVSSVAALAEIVADGRTGLVFDKGDAGSLAQALQRLLGDEKLRRSLSVSAQEWAATERDWSSIVGRLDGAYAQASGAVAT